MARGTLTSVSRPPNGAINRPHPANRGLRFSWQAVQAPATGALNLAQRSKATVTGSPTGGMQGLLGYCNNFATTTNLNWPATTVPAAVEPAGTIWWVGQFSSVSTAQDLFHTAYQSAGGYNLQVTNVGTIELGNATSSYASGITCAASVPYLIICSWSNTVCHFLLRRLDTGSVTQSGAVTITAASASNGQVVIGADSFQEAAAASQVAAVAFGLAFIPPDGQRQLSVDPWGPWRPDIPLPQTILFNQGRVPVSTPLTLSNTVTLTASRTNQTGKPLAKSVTAPGALVRQAGKLITNAVTAPATLVRQAGKLLTNTVTAPATLVRQTGKLLTNAVTSVASLTTHPTTYKLLTNAVTATASRINQTGKLLTNAVTLTGSRVDQIGKLCVNTVTLTAVRVSQISKTLTNVLTATASRVGQLGRTLANTVTSVASRINQTGKLLTNAVSAPATLTTNITRYQLLTNAVTLTASRVNQTGKLLINTVTLTASHVDQLGRLFTNTVTLTAVRISQTSKPLTNVVTSTVTRINQTGKLFTNAVTSTATRINQTGKLLVNAVTATASLTTNITKFKLITNTITVSATLVNQTGKLLTNAVTLTASRVDQIGKLITNAVTVVASRANQTGKLLVNTVTATATMTTQAVTIRLFTNTTTVTATLTKQTGKLLTNAASSVATLTKRTAKTLSNSVFALASLAKQIGRMFASTITSSASAVESLFKNVLAAISVTSIASLISNFIPGTSPPPSPRVDGSSVTYIGPLPPPPRQQIKPTVFIDFIAISKQLYQVASAIGNVVFPYRGRSVQKEFATETETEVVVPFASTSVEEKSLTKGHGRITLSSYVRSNQPVGRTTANFGTIITKTVARSLPIDDEVPDYDGGTRQPDDDFLSDLEDSA